MTKDSKNSIGLTTPIVSKFFFPISQFLVHRYLFIVPYILLLINPKSSSARMTAFIISAHSMLIRNLSSFYRAIFLYYQNATISKGYVLILCYVVFYSCLFRMLPMCGLRFCEIKFCSVLFLQRHGILKNNDRIYMLHCTLIRRAVNLMRYDNL